MEKYKTGDKVQVFNPIYKAWSNCVVMFHNEDRISLQFADGDKRGLYHPEQNIDKLTLKRGWENKNA